MKKSFILLATTLLALASCTRNQEIEIPEANLSLFARTESPADTKTVVESGTHVFWEPGDEIAVFMGEKAAKFSTDITAASGTATFKGTFGDATWPEEIDLWAVYPFSDDAVFDGETITTVLPSEQIARKGSFGKDMNLAIAHSTSSTLQFYNVGGGIRFSVTEEGIKKVMFEGLSGEIISGKVKIGFEDGLPVVKEVTGGSQFITLLPPAGTESFEKDTWYYIVAIPGALEGGYKMRFYKDSDYARKVSEKAVMIKRSIFGNIENADEGIEYEATTTHFPETEEEWMESAELTQSIGGIAGDLIDSLRKNHYPVADYIETLQNIEGVLDVWVDSDNDLVAIMQKDSLVVNYPDPRRFLHTSNAIDQRDDTFASFATNSISQNGNRNSIPRNPTRKSLIDKQAIILIPCEMPESDYYTTHNQYLRNCLIEMGYDSDNIVSKLGPEAKIEYFYGEELSKYDYIHITTHGDVMYYTYQKDDDDRRKGTCFASATEYDGAWAVYNLASKEIAKEDIALIYCDPVFDSVHNSKFYVGMTSEQLNNASFENSCVIVTACHSAETVNGIVGGTILPKFVDKGAGIASGYLITADGDYSEPYARFITKLMSHGISFQDADRYLKNATWFDEYLFKNGIEWMRLRYQKKEITPRPEQSPQPYYLNKLNISLHDDVVYENGIVELNWDFDFIPFDEVFVYKDFTTFEEHTEIIPFGVQYEVYINDMPPYVTEENCFEWDSPTIDDYSWYVVAKIMEGDTVLASYQSGIGHFTITEEPHYVTPEAIDLGLPSGLKWASFNLGATKADEFGDFFAWGETEPYYSCLDPLTWEDGKEAGYDWASYSLANGSMNLLTKYCTNPKYGFNGFTDGKGELDLVDDAANVILGDKWRIPTREEVLELIEMCSWERTYMNDVGGYTVTAPSGEYIFLPVAGNWSGTD